MHTTQLNRPCPAVTRATQSPPLSTPASHLLLMCLLGGDTTHLHPGPFCSQVSTLGLLPTVSLPSGSELAWWLKRPDSPKRCHVDHLASLGNTHIWTSGHSSNWWWQCYPSSLLSTTSPLPHSPAGPPSTGMPAWSWHRLFHGQTVLKPCQVKYKCSLLLTDDLNQSRTFLIFFSVYFCVLTHLWSKDSFPISNKNITLLSPSQTPVS